MSPTKDSTTTTEDDGTKTTETTHEAAGTPAVKETTKEVEHKAAPAAEEPKAE